MVNGQHGKHGHIDIVSLDSDGYTVRQLQSHSLYSSQQLHYAFVQDAARCCLTTFLDVFLTVSDCVTSHEDYCGAFDDYCGV